MDNHQTHVDDKIKDKIKSYNYDVAFLPANCTGKLQPLDIGVNKSFKDIYSTMWQNWFEDIINKPTSNKFESPTRELCISWIYKAAKQVQKEVIENSWNIYKRLEEEVPQGN